MAATPTGLAGSTLVRRFSPSRVFVTFSILLLVAWVLFVINEPTPFVGPKFRAARLRQADDIKSPHLPVCDAQLVRRFCHQACVREQNTGLIYFLHMRKAGGTSLSTYLFHRLMADGANVPGILANNTVRAALISAVSNRLEYESTRLKTPVANINIEPFVKEYLITLAHEKPKPDAPSPQSPSSAILSFGTSLHDGGHLNRLLYASGIPSSENHGLQLWWNEGLLFTYGILEDDTIPRVFVTHFRDPLARIISNYQMLARDGGGNIGKRYQGSLNEWIDLIVDKQDKNARKAKEIVELMRSTHDYEQISRKPHLYSIPDPLAWEEVSNYYVKRLIMFGNSTQLDCERVFRMLSGNVTKSDLQLAKDVLEQFDGILIADGAGLGSPEEEEILSENLGAAQFRIRSLSTQLPSHLCPNSTLCSPQGQIVKLSSFHSRTASEWEQKAVEYHDRDPRFPSLIDLKLQMDLDNPEALEKLRKLNELDMELFEFARTLAKTRRFESDCKMDSAISVPRWCNVGDELHSVRNQTTRVCNFAWTAGSGADKQHSDWIGQRSTTQAQLCRFNATMD